MTDTRYAAPHPLSLDDLDPESATTDRLIAMAHNSLPTDYPDIKMNQIPILVSEVL